LTVACRRAAASVSPSTMATPRNRPSRSKHSHHMAESGSRANPRQIMPANFPRGESPQSRKYGIPSKHLTALSLRAKPLAPAKAGGSNPGVTSRPGLLRRPTAPRNDGATAREEIMNVAADEIATGEHERLVLDALDKFLAAEVRPHVRALEHDDVYPAEIVEKMKALGLFGCTIAQEHGGLGLSTATYARIVERISATWMSLAGVINSHLILATAIERNGTAEQKTSFLPRLARGELRGGVGLTEPDCGTDLQAIRTVARRDGADYVVNGRKTWITNSLYGNCLALLVKTDPNATPRHQGMSVLIAEKGPGFAVERKLEKLGYRGIDTCELAFDDYRVPAIRLIGGVEGRGLQQILSGLELGRINVAARGVG